MTAVPTADDQVQNPLTLVMLIRSPDDHRALQAKLGHLQSLPRDKNPVIAALDKIATVHFARFVFLDETRLAVITTYDGDFDAYINEFVDHIGDVFNDAPAAHGRRPAAARAATPAGVPGLRPPERPALPAAVLQRLPRADRAGHPRRRRPLIADRREAAVLDLGDVQGLVVRGYTMPVARHLLLRVDAAADARALLGSLVDGDDRRPQVTTGTPWADKPDCCLNLSITFAGLRALGVPGGVAGQLPGGVRRGGGEPAPTAWATSGPARPPTGCPSSATRACTWCSRCSAQSAAGRGPRDGRPPGRRHARALRAVPPGRRSPRPPGRPLRLRRRDLPAHDRRRLRRAAVRTGCPWRRPGSSCSATPASSTSSPIRCPTPADAGPQRQLRRLPDARPGRRRLPRTPGRAVAPHRACPRSSSPPSCAGAGATGRPWSSPPTPTTPDPPLPPEAAQRLRLRRPVRRRARRALSRRGAHPAHVPPGLARRRQRRPQAPDRPARADLRTAHDPARPRDGHERGLLGLFIGVSLKDQFEFLMAEWANDGLFAPGLGRSKDPLLGAARRGGRHVAACPGPGPDRAHRPAPPGHDPGRCLLLPPERDRYPVHRLAVTLAPLPRGPRGSHSVQGHVVQAGGLQFDPETRQDALARRTDAPGRHPEPGTDLLVARRR